MKKFLILSITLLVAVCACQKVEETDNQFSENNLNTPSLVTRSSSFTSQFGVNWDVVPKQNASCTYAAFKSMQVTCDATYLYLLLTADPTMMTTSSSYNYANVLNVYLGNSSDTSNSYWTEKAVNVSEMGGWLVKNGAPYFTSWGSGVTAQAVDVSGTYYYEIRYPRSINAHLQGSDVLVGVYMNNRYNVNNTNSSGYDTVGIRPNNGSNMYWLSLNNYLGVGDPVNPALVSRTYTESDSDIPNPERGLYKQIDYVFEGSLPDIKQSDITGFSGSLILPLFVLKDYRYGDDLSAAIPRIKAILGAIRTAGKKAIVRFAYTKSSSSSTYDAPLNRMVSHISQLGTVFSEYTDVIYLVQCGFIGAWGEWYYTTYFRDPEAPEWPDYSYYDPSRGESVKWYVNDPWWHTTQVINFQNRQSVIGALLSAVPSSRQVALRKPAFKRMYRDAAHFESWTPLDRVSTGSSNSRLSFHNDVYMIDDADQMGTFDTSYDTAMWLQQSAYLAVGGETATINSEMSHYQDYINYRNSLHVADVVNNIKQYHISYMHEHPGSYMYQWWDTKGWLPAIKKAMGYRLWLSNLEITGASLSSGQTVHVSLTLQNTGAAPVINSRPMKLVLLTSGGSATVLTPVGSSSSSFGDIREILSDNSKQFNFDVTLPRTLSSGDRLAIWMPDADPNNQQLYNRSEYAIRLANSNMDFVGKGYNIIYTK